MVIRPLADLYTNVRFIRPLVILRKGVGVFSASIIVSFLLVKLITDPGVWLQAILSSQYWSLHNFAFFAHVADFSAVLLLITSNNLSKKLLGLNWKRLQRLSYVYFYGSGLYVVFVLHDYLVLAFMTIVTVLTTLAWKRNHNRTKADLRTV
jgi:DMSO/TMAO reductase YedYZ heme-binding membrane subunit